MDITIRQFQIDTDLNLVWDFLVEIYDRQKGGVAAPFFEYAVFSSWMDKTYLALDRLWFDGQKVVGFVFHEFPIRLASIIAEAANKCKGGSWIFRVRDKHLAHNALQAGPDKRLLPALKEAPYF